MNKNLDIWWDKLLKLIELLKPKYYNNLTARYVTWVIKALLKAFI